MQTGFVRTLSDEPWRSTVPNASHPKLQEHSTPNPHARAEEDLQSLAYYIAHDMRTYLRGAQISSMDIHDAVAQNSLNEDGKQALQILERSVSNASLLVNGLLEYVRLGNVPIIKRDLDISAIAESIASEMKARSRSRIYVQTAMRARGDASLIPILLQNLIENACKYQRRPASAMVLVGQLEDGTFFVRDNGIGFPMEFEHKIYLPCERLITDSNFSGVGIGLANAKRILTRHGGRIWAESSVGYGACFYFTLP